MNNRILTLLPKVKQILTQYGLEVDILRDVYENEEGIQTLQESSRYITTIKVIVDNSKVQSSMSNYYRTEGITQISQTATIYYAYDGNEEPLQEGDYFILDGLIYRISQPQDIMHYHILYQTTAEVTINE